MSTAGKARRAWGNENWRAENHFKHMTSAIAQVRPAVELEVAEVCASAEGPAWGREGFADRDKEVTMKEKTLGTKLLLAAVTLGVLAYFSIQAVRYFGDPLTTTIAYQYQVEMSTVLSGYVVRDEAILTDDTSGLLQLQRAEGERISDGGVVALVYADQATLDRQKEIQSLHTQIEQLQYAEEAALGAEVSLRLDAQILQTIRDYRGALAADRLDTAEDCGAELRSLVMKRDYTYSDTEDLSAQMAELQSQLSSLRAQAGSSVRQITAPQAGLYSAVVDGYENILTPESLETLTPRTLAALEPDESLRSNRLGKLVLGDTWYYVTALEESEAQTLQESGRLKLRFAKGVGRDLSVKLTHISEAEGGRVVAVFQGDTYLSELTLLRQQSAEVIRQTTTGIRVPKEALRVRERTVTDEDGNESVVSETGVYCMVGMKARFKPVDVLYSGDDFALVRSTLDTAEEVSKTQEQIRLRAGDEVIITAYDLYDGKVIGS